MTTLVGVVMGSRTDWQTMKFVGDTMAGLKVSHEVRIVSARRNSEQLVKYIKSAEKRGIKLIIASAYIGNVYLPGLLASMTDIPILAVPVEPIPSKYIDAMNTKGDTSEQVLTIGRTGAINTALLAASMLANEHNIIRKALTDFHTKELKPEFNSIKYSEAV